MEMNKFGLMDGIDLQSGELLEAKYIENPNNSLYRRC